MSRVVVVARASLRAVCSGGARAAPVVVRMMSSEGNYGSFVPPSNTSAILDKEKEISKVGSVRNPQQQLPLNTEFC